LLQIQKGASLANPMTANLVGRRLLVVEPNEGNRQRLRRQLAEWSLESVEASDAETALALAAESTAGGTPLAAALICLVPAEGPGLDLARRLRSERSWANRPVILLTKQSERLAARSLNAEGVSACLFRPMRMRQFAATLQRLLAPPRADGPELSVEKTALTENALQVLLVEDNAVNRRVGTLMLKKLNCEVIMATDGQQALTLLSEKKFDLVLMDCQMPELDGFETTRQIRHAEMSGQWNGRHRQLIVAMTANAMEGDRERCIQSGMDDYLPKPMRPEQLRAVVSLAREMRAKHALV
jgi:CheY-like chemotaxis protein